MNILLLFAVVALQVSFSRKLRTHKGLFPALNQFLIYSVETDRVWNIFSHSSFQIFDEDSDESIEEFEWRDTITEITGSETIGFASVPIYYGIIIENTEWYGEINQNDWENFMNLVRRYLLYSMQINGQTYNNSTSSQNNSQPAKNSTIQNHQIIRQKLQNFAQFLLKHKKLLSFFFLLIQFLEKHLALGTFLTNDDRRWKIVCVFLFNFFDVNADNYIQEDEIKEVSQLSGLNLPVETYWSLLGYSRDKKVDLNDWMTLMSYAKSTIETNLNIVLPDMSFWDFVKDIV